MAAVICFGIVAVWSASRNIETFRQVNEIRQTVECCDRIFVQMLDIETGMREFVGSGDEKLLDRYLEGVTSIHESFAMAQRLTHQNPKQRVQLQTLEPLIEQKLAFVDETVQLCRKGDLSGARQRIASGQGRRMMDQIRKVIAQVETEESVELRTRVADEETATHTTIVIIIVSGLISLALVGLAGLIVRHDFWKRKDVEADLHVASERLALATRATNVGIWDWNIADAKLFWDDATYDIYGVTRGQFVPSYEAFEAMIHPDDRQRVREDVQSAVRGEKEYALEFRVVWPDKSVRYLETKATILRDDSGKPIRMLGTNWDVTERKQVEDALRQSEETMRMMTESVPQMVWMCRPDGWNIFINQKWVDYTGQSVEECNGHGWNKPFHPDDQLRAWNAWKLAIKTGGPYDLECRLRRTDGAYHWFLIRGLPVRDAQGAILKWFGTCTDIDDRKKAEEQIEALNARLAQQAASLEKEVCKRTAKLSESMKSLETLTYSMAHDLRTPVRAMSSITVALLEDVPLDKTGKDYAQRIHNAARRMDKLLSDLLDYGRLTHIQFCTRPVNLKHQIDNVLTHFAEDISKTNAAIRIHEPMPLVLANERLLEQTLSNLLSNALKFVAPGMAPKIFFHAETRGSAVRLWVEDNGIGIAPEYREKIFQLFQRLHPTEVFPGTGVGLAIVHRAVEDMGGHVGVESEKGWGSRFWIELPAAENADDTTTFISIGDHAPTTNRALKTVA